MLSYVETVDFSSANAIVTLSGACLHSTLPMAIPGGDLDSARGIARVLLEELTFCSLLLFQRWIFLPSPALSAF